MTDRRVLEHNLCKLHLRVVTNTHYREFLKEYTVLDPEGQTLSLFPEGPKALQEISSQFVLKDLKLYIPEETHNNMFIIYV